ncbi:MAG: DUF3944 domain-containing protein [Fusobacteriaceae bacterium]|nr:DUF3944 domain-containing protein [Fusobacteriaceae bacterium]
MGSYRFDHDLEFFRTCSHEELEELETILIWGTKKNKDQNKRNISEQITREPLWKEFHETDRTKYWSLLARELQEYGGNTIINTGRGGGVYYREILEDVMKKVKTPFDGSLSTSVNEQNLLSKVFADSMCNFSKEQQERIIRELDKNGFPSNLAEIGTGIVEMLKLGGMGTVISYFTGPIGWLYAGEWIIFGPAYRITKPAVIRVSILRIIKSAELNNEANC